jgi:GTP cyclohydrolase I
MNDHPGPSDAAEAFGYEKLDQYNARSIERIAGAFRGILEEIGEDPTRDGLAKTPERYAKALQFLTHGHDLDPAEILRAAMFREEYRQMVIVRDIEIYSLCEHHVLPFFGKAHVAYILTTQIRDCIQATLRPLGVAVVIEAQHMCMVMRGVQKQHSIATTSAFTGGFEQDRTRAEFMRLIG